MASLNKIDLIIRTGELLGRDEVIGHFLVYCVSTPSLLLDKMDARDFAFNLHTAVVEWVDPRRYSMPTLCLPAVPIVSVRIKLEPV